MSASFPERHPTCGSCGAFLQQARWHGIEILRCPWANKEPSLDGGVIVIWCNKPIADRIVGGMSREAVRNV